MAQPSKELKDTPWKAAGKLRGALPRPRAAGKSDGVGPVSIRQPLRPRDLAGTARRHARTRSGRQRVEAQHLRLLPIASRLLGQTALCQPVRLHLG
jgi:hypothetical protein